MDLVVIYGISSFLGFSISQRLSENKNVNIIGVYRNKNQYVEKLANNYSVIKLSSMDLMTNKIVAGDVISDEVDNYERITVLYCCGMWNHSSVYDLNQYQIDQVTRIGFRAPIEAMASYFSYLDKHNKNWQFINITGLAGEKGAVRYNGLYNATTTALCNFVRSAAMEISGSGRSVCVFSIGLFDKGQKYINDLCSQLVIGRPLDLDNVVAPICQQIVSPNYALNGAVVELSDGLFNYQEAVRLMVSN